DLSVGAMMLLVTMVVGVLAGHVGLPGALALLIGIGTGAGCGFVNGLLVAQVRLPPFIVTLGTLNVFIAVALLMSGGRSVPGAALGDFLTFTNAFFPIGPFHMTMGALLVIVMYLGVGFALSETAWGRHVYAVGDDASAARLAGIQVRRLLISVYTLAGVIVAMSAWVLIGRVGAATTSSAVDANLDSITAVVIGGTSLFGGSGTMFGTVVGVFIPVVLAQGLIIVNVQSFWQQVVIGAILIIAVYFDQLRRRTRSRR
ncbi:MAG TPA: ABC transporter permease, partial [Thermoleophilia bacterium]|nr:ABC transporter permease [Thermoleophilia bacterium]